MLRPLTLAEFIVTREEMNEGEVEVRLVRMVEKGVEDVNCFSFNHYGFCSTVKPPIFLEKDVVW